MKITFHSNRQVTLDRVLIGHWKATLNAAGDKVVSLSFTPWDAHEGFCYRVESSLRALRERIKTDAVLLQVNRK